MSTFDFTAYRAALLALDAERWVAFFAPGAEWREYRHTDPPRAPHVMRGTEQIGEFLRGIAGSDLRLSLDNEVVDSRRAAYTLTVLRPDGSRIVENVILTHEDGLIAIVEAWD